MPIPPPLRRNDHSGIDRSVCGRTASCAFAANNQFYLPFRHFPIGEINSLFLRKFAYVLSIVGGIFPRIFHCREAGEKWRKRNHFIRRESKGKNRGGGRERERGSWEETRKAVPFPFHLYLRARVKLKIVVGVEGGRAILRYFHRFSREIRWLSAKRKSLDGETMEEVVENFLASRGERKKENGVCGGMSLLRTV